MSVIALDVDGVLADFNQPYINLLREVTGLPYPDESDTYPDCWDFDKAGGATPAQLKLAWEGHIKVGSNYFWYNLDPYPGAEEFLDWLSGQSHDCYFVTSRPGQRSKGQTENWLLDHGWKDTPTVIQTSLKGLACKTTGAKYYIDDKNENIIDVIDQSPGTVAFLRARAYNDPNLGDYRGDLDKFRKLIEGVKE